MSWVVGGGGGGGAQTHFMVGPSQGPTKKYEVCLTRAVKRDGLVKKIGIGM